jgi:hypothetical protein
MISVKKYEFFGIIEEVAPDYKWNWPLIYVSKKDINGCWTEVRICVDFHTLNNLISKDEQFTIH